MKIELIVYITGRSDGFEAPSHYSSFSDASLSAMEIGKDGFVYDDVYYPPHRINHIVLREL